MSNALAGFDFVLEFSERLAAAVLKTSITERAIQSRFRHDDPGQPGLINSRSAIGGRSAFQSYMVNIEAGYDIILRDPSVRFRLGHPPTVEVTAAFDLKMLRNVVANTYDPANGDSPLAFDPADVKQGVVYTETYRTAPIGDPYPMLASPPETGRLTLLLNVAEKPETGGRRAFGQTALLRYPASLVSINATTPNDPRLKALVAALAGKALVELLAREVNDFDFSPLVGDLSAFSMSVRGPALKVNATAGQRLLAIAFNERATVGYGDLAFLGSFADNSPFAASFRESMLGQLVAALYQNGTIPHRYARNGSVAPAGSVLLQQPRISIVRNRLVVDCILVVGSGPRPISVGVKAHVRCDSQAGGGVQVVIERLDIPVPYPGLAVRTIMNTLLFHLFEGLIGGFMTSVLGPASINSLRAGLQQFLNSGALAFGFQSPIRGTPRFVQIEPTAVNFLDGVCTVQGDYAIV